MRIKLLFIFVSLSLKFDAYCSCEDIAENIGICKEYSCLQPIGNENYIKHKILGLNSENLCVYVEKQGNDEMICYHSSHGMQMEKKYFENVFKTGNQETDDFTDIVHLRAKECFFISDYKLDYMDQNNIMKEAVDNDFEILSQYDDVKSIFFDEVSVNRIISEMEKFNLKSSTTIKEQVVDDFNCQVVRLDAIVHFSADIWKIWVNGKLFTNTKDLKVQSVTEDHVVFVWAVDRKTLKKQISDSKNISFSSNSIIFTLYPKQKFDLESLSIK